MTFLVTVALRNVSQGLTPAKGRQDHTTSSVHIAIARLTIPLRPSRPASRVVTIASAPLHETGRVIDSMISEKWKHIFVFRNFSA
jgi:hypothetical protein